MHRHMLWHFQCPHFFTGPKLLSREQVFGHCLNKAGYGFIAQSHSSPMFVSYLPTSKHSSGTRRTQEFPSEIREMGNKGNICLQI